MRAGQMYMICAIITRIRRCVTMASNKTGIRKAKASSGQGLGSALLSIVAVGFTLGAALIGAAVALGEAIEGIQADGQKKLDERREADREEVRRIIEAESGDGRQ